MVDGGILGDVGGAISGFNTNVGSGLVTAFIFLQIPMFIIFGLSTILLFWLLLANQFVWVDPRAWKYKITLLRPFADGSIGLYPDMGALCMDGGIKRFKLKTENVVMQKPDTADVYPNNEIMLLSLSAMKKVNAKRVFIDEERNVVMVDIEDPAVADGYYFDRIEAQDPNLIYKRINQIYMLLIFWFFAGVILCASNFLIIYPIMVKFLFAGG